MAVVVRVNEYIEPKVSVTFRDSVTSEMKTTDVRTGTTLFRITHQAIQDVKIVCEPDEGGGARVSITLVP